MFIYRHVVLYTFLLTVFEDILSFSKAVCVILGILRKCHLKIPQITVRSVRPSTWAMPSSQFCIKQSYAYFWDLNFIINSCHDSQRMHMCKNDGFSWSLRHTSRGAQTRSDGGVGRRVEKCI
jgi:hypothetical protein